MNARRRDEDVFGELVELSTDIVTEIRDHLRYYRASVYKHETAAAIKGGIEDLRFILSLIRDDSVDEVMRDYDALSDNPGATAAPGECSFAVRVTSMLGPMSDGLSRLAETPAATCVDGSGAERVGQTVAENRGQLLRICRNGTRSWSYFQSI